MIGLTPRQAECLRFVAGYQTAHRGVSPSVREIRAGIGLASKNGVCRMLAGLAERGAIRRMFGRARAIELLADMPVPRIGDVPLFFISVADLHEGALADG